jgi:hypothetical protein
VGMCGLYACVGVVERAVGVGDVVFPMGVRDGGSPCMRGRGRVSCWQRGFFLQVRVKEEAWELDPCT